MPEVKTSALPVPTVRAYLKRLPSGAYRVTVLSPSLSGPLFRMYPAECSEAEAVARAVGRALEKLPDHCEQHSTKEPESESGIRSSLDIRSDAGLALLGDNEQAEKEKAKRAPYAGQGNQAEGGCADAHLPFPFPRSEQQGAEQPFQPPVVATQHRRPPRRVCVVWQGLLA